MRIGIMIDNPPTRAVIELEESLTPSFVPYNVVRFERIKLVTMLDLVREKGDGKLYIARQYGG